MTSLPARILGLGESDAGQHPRSLNSVSDGKTAHDSTVVYSPSLLKAAIGEQQASANTTV
jgi:hypothetical protein